MYRPRNKLRLISALIATLFLAAAPGLQAYQANFLSDDCFHSCCCGCSHEQDEAPINEAVSLEGSCCCSVSTPEPPTETPFEAQLHPTANPDTFAPVVSATSHVTVVEIKPYQAARLNQPSVHGPPLYVLNASYII